MANKRFWWWMSVGVLLVLGGCVSSSGGAGSDPGAGGESVEDKIRMIEQNTQLTEQQKRAEIAKIRAMSE